MRTAALVLSLVWVFARGCGVFMLHLNEDSEDLSSGDGVLYNICVPNITNAFETISNAFRTRS